MFEYLQQFRANFPDRKYYQLIDKVYCLENLEEAWKRVKANSGCAGIDKQSITDFLPHRKQYFREIQRAIQNGKYKPTPVLRKYIPKKNGKLRPLGIPTVKERILQQAMKNVLEPIFEVKFKDYSYGYRPNRSAHEAIARINNNFRQGYTWVIDADIKAFFDSVDHTKLMSFVGKEIADGKILGLIESWLKAGVIIEGELQETIEGTPQGGVISPLLANIYLHELDSEIAQMAGIRMVRYADDFVVMCKTKHVANLVMKELKKVIQKLKLEINTEKTKIVNAKEEEFGFLGFNIKYIPTGGRIKLTPQKLAVQKFKQRIKEITKRNMPMKATIIIGQLNKVIRGWGNYFRIGNVSKIFLGLDVWIRMRVRSYIEKKKSRYSHMRLPNVILQSEYKLASLYTLRRISLPIMGK